jgi:hypothetical protein
LDSPYRDDDEFALLLFLNAESVPLVTGFVLTQDNGNVKTQDDGFVKTET